MQRPDIPARCRRVLLPLTAAAVLPLVLAIPGCDTVPDYANPAEWYRGVVGAFDSEEPQAEAARAEPGAGRPFPDLVAVTAGLKTSGIDAGLAAGSIKLVGDVSCDGTVNAVDAALVLQFGAGLLEDLGCPNQGDVNDDGMITSVDAALILQFTAGLLDNPSP